MVKSLLWRLLFHGRAFVSWYKGSLLLWTTVQVTHVTYMIQAGNWGIQYYLRRETYENNPAWHWCFCNDFLINKRAIEHNKSYSSLRPNGTAIENVIMRDPSKSYLVERHLGGVFKCSWPLLQKLNKSGFPTVRRSCFTQSSELICKTHQDIDAIGQHWHLKGICACFR